jgi:uncharacterized ParB-like nuclease family protein
MARTPYRPDFRHQTEICLRLTKVNFVDEDAEDVNGRKVGVLRRIPVKSVLAEAWDEGRLNRCRLQLAEGTPAPRIKVVGLRRKGHPTLYAVGDGMHRTIAAMEAGRRTIRAEIRGWYDCDPTRFLLWRGCLYGTTGHPYNHQAVTHRMSETTRAELVSLGVLLVPDDANPFDAFSAHTANRKVRR